MDRKARENLEAARALLRGDDPPTNAATSRAYYAAYQACWTKLSQQGARPEKVGARGEYYRHDTLPDRMKDRGLLSEDSARDLHFLWQRRVAADYELDDVLLHEAREAVDTAGELVGRLIGEKQSEES